ncbi:MAG: adenylate/guanylate cyclase domain-containing protein [Actinomycetota bacterium]
MRCPACDEENPDRAKFCLNCATPLTAPVEPAAEVRKVVTIVFADMAGSTAIGERLDPEALRRVQARYFDAMAAVIEQHSGTVEKYIGDAVMAVFGIPRLHEDDPLRAVRAAFGMQAALSALNDELERDHDVRIAIRIGVNTGEVVAGDPTAGQRLVTGDTVNVAARLEQAAGSGEVLLGETTYRLVKDAVEVEPVEPLELKGKSERVPAFRLQRVLIDTAGHVRNLDSPMVGRTKELELFRRGLERARDERTSHLFTLLGPAGVGKSRLVREFLADADATVLRGRCLSYGEGITYYALGEIVRQAAGITESEGAVTSLATLTRRLADAEDGDRIARLIGGLFGWAEPAAPEDAQWGVRKLFEHLAKDRPLVVLFDDIHWAEPLLLQLIDHLADWTRDAELLLVCVARPELLEIRPEWGGGKMNATSILLEPLAGDEAGALLNNLLGDAALPGAARERILAAAEGNPLFVEEMIGMLIDDGLLRFEGGAWQAVDDLADLTVPPTIQLLLAARLDRLDAEERAVIERGAVEGKVFHTGAVTSLVSEGLRGQVRPRLLALARKELIRPDRAEFAGEDAFRFRHLLIRDAAYQAMPKEQRAELHEGFARWLTDVAGDQVGEYQEILGHHLEQAYRYRSELGPPDDRTRALARDAARALHLSAERAMVLGDLAGATHLLERTVDLAEGLDRARAIVDLGESLETRGEFVRVIEVLGGFLGSPEASEAPALRIRADAFMQVALSQMEPEHGIVEGHERSAVLLAEAETLDDNEAITAALLALSSFAFWRGRCAEALAISERLLPRVGQLNAIYRGFVSDAFLTEAYFGSTPVDEGFRLVERMREIIGDGVRGRMKCETLTGSLLAMAGNEEGFDAAMERVDRGWDELGNPQEKFMQNQGRAESLWRLGREAEAEALLRGAKAFLDQIGETGFNSTLTSVLATFLAESGRFDEAETLVEQARPMASADDFGALVPIGWASGLVASARGDHDEALRAIDEALGLVRETDYLTFHADTLRFRGQILWDSGRHGDADLAFAEALAMYERKGNVASARRMQAWRDRA